MCRRSCWRDRLLAYSTSAGNVAEKRKLVQISRFDKDMFSLFDRTVGEEDEEAADELDFFGAANERTAGDVAETPHALGFWLKDPL